MRDGVIGGNEVMENDIFPYRDRFYFQENSTPGSYM